MTNNDIKNYFVTTVVSFMSGMPLLFIEEVGYMLFVADMIFIILYILFTCWNSIGDYIIINYVLKGKGIDKDAAMLPAINYFYKYKNNGKECQIFYTQSRVPYFILISSNKVIVSLGAEEYILKYSSDILFKAVPDEVFKKHVNTPGWNRQFDRASPTPLPLKSYTLSAGPTPSV